MSTKPPASSGPRAHAALVRAILAELGSLPGVVLTPNASGRAKYVSAKDGRAFVVPYGAFAPGGPDILAVVAPLGRLLCFEVKTGAATTTPEQKACHAALRAVGVAVHVVRSVEEARAALLEAMGGRSPVRDADVAGELLDAVSWLYAEERRTLLEVARRLVGGRRVCDCEPQAAGAATP